MAGGICVPRTTNDGVVFCLTHDEDWPCSHFINPEARLRTDHVVIDVWVKGQRRSLDYADAPTDATALGMQVLQLIDRLKARA